jgi:hypothetical protein
MVVTDGTNRKTPPPLPVATNGRTRPIPGPPTAPARQSTPDLIKDIAHEMKDLTRKQIELAVTEARADLRRELKAAANLGLGAVGAVVSVTLLLVTAAFALSLMLPAWAAGLVVSGAALLASAGVVLYARRKRVQAPLAHARQALHETAALVKEGGA